MSIVLVIVLIQLGILITCFVQYSQVEQVAHYLWHEKFSSDTHTKFQDAHHCFGYSSLIDVSLTRYQVSCQEPFEAVLGTRRNCNGAARVAQQTKIFKG